MSDSGTGRFARWSQRKHAARQARQGGASPVPLADDEAVAKSADDNETSAQSDIQQTAAAQDSDDSAGQTEAGAPTAGQEGAVDITATLTPLEELTADSDYTQFLVDGVPQALRNAALRKLWTSDPVFAVLDGLNDYDEDFNLTDRAITLAETNYKIGRGFLTDDDEPKIEPGSEPELEPQVADAAGPEAERQADREQSEEKDDTAGAAERSDEQPADTEVAEARQDGSAPEPAGAESGIKTRAIAAVEPESVNGDDPDSLPGKESQHLQHGSKTRA